MPAPAIAAAPQPATAAPPSPRSLAAGAVPASAAGGYTVTATIAVGSDPFGAAPDPAAGTVYVINYSDGTVSVIDAATRAVTAAISLPWAPSRTGWRWTPPLTPPT